MGERGRHIFERIRVAEKLKLSPLPKQGGDMDTKKETKFLQCVLTEAELKKYSSDLARSAQDKNEVESRKKQAMSDFNAQISAKDADIVSFATKINNGWEFRNVDCTWKYDWTHKTKTLYRDDTQERLAHVPIEEDEKQGNLL